MKSKNFKEKVVFIPLLGISIILVDNEDLLLTMIEQLEAAKDINVDFEGIDLSKTGTVCLGQFHVRGSRTVFLVDFIEITDPFQACQGRLKNIVESKNIRKIIFDPRNDSDAIFHQFGVTIQNLICLQLCEVALRRQSGIGVNFLLGLGKVMENHLSLEVVNSIKQAGKQLFAPELGGRYDVFRERPLQKEIIEYCAIDVFYFDELFDKLFVPLSLVQKQWVLQNSDSRALECKMPGYVAKGRDRAIAPK
jgi:exonuclease 3'-5' domain-containing protein 1